MTAAMGSSCDVSGAAHLPRGGDALRGVDRRRATAFRLEGVAPSVAHRTAALQRLLKSYGPLETLADVQSREFWRGDARRRAIHGRRASARAVLWRISTTPAHAADIGRVLIERAGAKLLYDWAGGLIWAALPPSDDAAAPIVRAAVAAAGGHATLIRAPADAARRCRRLRAAAVGLAALTKRVEGELRSAGRPQSRAHVGGRLTCRPPSRSRSSPIRDVAESEKILRTCVHCGFCTATCPTYVLARRRARFSRAGAST